MPLIGNVIKPLAERVLIPLWLTAAASATDAPIHRNKRTKEQIRMLLGPLGASLLENLLFDKGKIRAGKGEIAASQGHNIVQAYESF